MGEMNYLYKANKNNIRYLFVHHWPLFVLEIVFAFVSGISGAVSAYLSKSFINLIVIDRKFQAAIALMLAVSFYYLFRSIIQSLLKVYSGYAFSKVRIFSKLAFADKTTEFVVL